MMDLWDTLLGSNFMPHGHCYFWQPGMVWLQVVSNASIGLAYLSISLTLAYLVHRVRDIPFQWVYVAFGVFIITCGFTHFMDVWVIWTPLYWLDGTIRAITAVASVGTAILLFPLIPKAVALAGAARLAHERGLKLEELNVELAALYERSRETLAETIPQLVWTSTPDGAIDYLNRRWSDYAGELHLGEAWKEVVHPDDLPTVLARWGERLGTGEDYGIECRLRRKDGDYRWFLVQARPLRDAGGRIVKWFGTCTDVHDDKLVAEEREDLLLRTQEAVRARDVFLAIAAHELKTPLTPIRLEIEGLLRALKEGRVDRITPERLDAKLGTVERQISRLEKLVTLLLDVSRIAGGRLDLNLEEVDLGEVAREVVERHRPDAERAGAAIELRIEPGAIGRFDRLRLDQVVTNLLANAITYGQGKPITVVVDVDAERAILRVTDRGVGVADEDQARIFERFERAVSERHYGGMGLGLWIVRQIVEATGGRISVESALGQGATFTVELPRHGRSAA